MNDISVIIPVFNEEENVENIITELNKLPYQFTYIFVDDGSTDSTWMMIKKLAERNNHIKAISLSRNFGKEQAVSAGLYHCSSDVAIIIDGDLQHPPAVISALIEKWKSTGCDVVRAIKTNRDNESHDSIFFVPIFYYMYKKLTNIELKGASDFKLITKPIIQAYQRLGEQGLFFRGLIPWLGFHQETIEFKVEKRINGSPKWSFLKRAATGINAITSFSSAPLHMVTIIGFIFLIFSTILGLNTLYSWLQGNSQEGFTTVILLLLIIGATIMISLGIIGQYIAHIHNEVKQRPRYLVRDKIGLSHER